MDKVTAAQLARLYCLLAAGPPKGAGLAPVTVRKVHVTIGAVFDAALDEGFVVVNPARKRAARPPSAKAVKASRGEAQVWTAPQLRAFLGWAREYKGADATLWEVYAATGCRRSEVLALRWSDVDLRGRRVKVRQVVDSVTREMKGTKSGGLVLSTTMSRRWHPSGRGARTADRCRSTLCGVMASSSGIWRAACGTSIRCR
ncbi:tyrosine-type recombinase/integrase [Dietzia sp. SLG310A2-38A2]|nr:tyrosine-type recombinase/integrase [Dietzia sp. SLG310A2-38A2]